MRFVLTSAACVGLAVSAGSAPLLAQLQSNGEKQMTCNNGNRDGDRARHCEIREQSLPSIGRLNIDSSPNGGTVVKGWNRSDVLVRARVEAQGENEGAAANLVSRVMVDSNGGQVRATGPERTGNNSGWSVSYEIFVPQITDLTLKTVNGGITISDVRGQIHFDAVNGGVNLKRVMGDITGATVNGGIQVEMAGNTWDGRQMELTTHNGGVTVSMPAHFNARIQAETGMGRIQSDFPVPGGMAERERRWDFAVGAGGPPIHIKTGNGGIHLKRTEAQ